MPYENKDDDTMDQTDDAGNVNYFINISFAKFSLFLKRETNCKSNGFCVFLFHNKILCEEHIYLFSI